MYRITGLALTSALVPAFTLAMPLVAAAAEEQRSLAAHVHGTGAMNIAIEGQRVAMELGAPGADIVGFEYKAVSAEDRAAVETAIADLAQPLKLFRLPAAAGCTVTAADVALASEEDEVHDHDAHDEEAHDDHAHDDHAHDEEAHGEKDHEEHAHDAHGHEQDDHAHDTTESGEHTEFKATYLLDCATPEAIETITFAYFERFPNALKLDLQIVSDAGARSVTVERDAPLLDMRGMI